MDLIETGDQYDLNGIIGNNFNHMSMSSGEEGVRGRKIGGRAWLTVIYYWVKQKVRSF